MSRTPRHAAGPDPGPPRPQGACPSAHFLTVGHSSRSIEAFLALLEAFEVRAVADVRRYPTSRKFPHFDRSALRDRLEAEGIAYVWFEELGGRRHGRPDRASPNEGIESPGFRNYADHMATDAFRAAAARLLDLGARRRTAILCAERLYWRCHRRLLCDFLTAQGATVEHILDRDEVRPHRLWPGAVLTADGGVIYPPEGGTGQLRLPSG